MKTFEEKYNQWVDGALGGKELEEFEVLLDSMPDVKKDRNEARQLGSLLRTHLIPKELENGDFFNHQLMERITVDASPAKTPKQRPFFSWSLPRMAWAGAFCLILAFVLYQFLAPNIMHEPPSAQDYMAQILEVQKGDPSISVSTFQSKKNEVTVLWIDGLDYLPDDYGL